MKPSIGRVVHYTSYGTPGGEYTSQCRAAMITEICPDPDGCVGLFIANPTGIFLNQHVEQDEIHKAGGTWHWPERVDE